MSDDIENQTDEQNEPSALRKKLDEVLAENKVLKAEKRHSVYAEAGIPNGAYDLFDEKFTGELTPDGLRTFAQDKGFALVSGDVKKAEPADGAGGEDRLDQLEGGVIPPREPSLNDQISEAEQKGDWAKFNQLNAKKLEAIRNS